MPRLKRMLLVEDDARDVELTLEALEESNLAPPTASRSKTSTANSSAAPSAVRL